MDSTELNILNGKISFGILEGRDPDHDASNLATADPDLVAAIQNLTAKITLKYETQGASRRKRRSEAQELKKTMARAERVQDAQRWPHCLRTS